MSLWVNIFIRGRGAFYVEVVAHVGHVRSKLGLLYIAGPSPLYRHLYIVHLGIYRAYWWRGHFLPLSLSSSSAIVSILSLYSMRHSHRANPLKSHKLYTLEVTIEGVKEKKTDIHIVELSIEAWKQEEGSSQHIEAFHREKLH